jgi:hypothetical protein
VSRHRPRAYVWPAIASAAVLGTWALALVPPLAFVFEKEGAIEHASHLALAIAIAFWSAAAIAARDNDARVFAIALAIVCALLAAEEIDWGATYGMRAIADAMRSGWHRPNLHNALGGRPYPFFVVPLALAFATPFMPRARRSFGAASPSRSESAAFAIAAGALAISELVPLPGADTFEEGGELVLYALVACAGASARARIRASRSSA